MASSAEWQRILDMDIPAVIRDWVQPDPPVTGPLDHPVDLISTLVFEYGDMREEVDADEDTLDAMYCRICDALRALAERDRTPYE